MSGKEDLKPLLKEAGIYRDQGLLDQAKEKYLDILNLIKKDQELSKDQELIDDVNNKIKGVESDLTEIEEATESPELDDKVQDLISNLFSFSKNKEVAAIEGAVALAKFGQYEKALAQLQKLINEGTLPMMAAKNMLRCHLILASPKEAVDQYKRWVLRTSFSKGELRDLRDFLDNILKKEGIKVNLPKVEEGAPEKGKKSGRAEEILEISTVRVTLDHGPMKGQALDFDVAFQLGNTVSFIIKAKEKDLVNVFKPGSRLSNIQCYSPMSLFNASGIISERKKIETGAKRGDYSFDLTIDGQ